MYPGAGKERDAGAALGETERGASVTESGTAERFARTMVGPVVAGAAGVVAGGAPTDGACDTVAAGELGV